MQRLDRLRLAGDAGGCARLGDRLHARVAMRSCASKNSCGGVGCISEIALYGNGSLTQSVKIFGAERLRARPTAVSTAFSVISDAVGRNEDSLGT